MLPALRAAIVFALLTGLVYPLVTVGAAELLFPWQARGSLVERDGVVLGSPLVGQPYAWPEYFHARPSAGGYDPLNTGGTNLAVASPKYKEELARRVAEVRREEGVSGPLPADYVTASGSGLDPHISVAAAELQIPRIARVTGISEAELREMVARHTLGKSFGIWGEPRVELFSLNAEIAERLGRLPRPETSSP
ncbi:MAG: Potassium-transporting ATPase C chain [Brockia lithotrophica]|uniref:Potassium-transporting ATPase KdpC subunit n=1 Tax=Brockia lithotrophica TaxID=933949 RepID=A0A2T5G4T0_9BACL|nr:potassium-transporting ATPase subunit KdpC [Brockia lithotrophica]MBT9253610.1 potassium-transporting ATPase subunit KdpC [Brockia lithotrophica]PTQ51184.1 MAG: Potassium-transporting ATPase C chain [Brockia lithotrophica]